MGRGAFSDADTIDLRTVPRALKLRLMKDSPRASRYPAVFAIVFAVILTGSSGAVGCILEHESGSQTVNAQSSQERVSDDSKAILCESSVRPELTGLAGTSNENHSGLVLGASCDEAPKVLSLPERTSSPNISFSRGVDYCLMNSSQLASLLAMCTSISESLYGVGLESAQVEEAVLQYDCNLAPLHWLVPITVGDNRFICVLSDHGEFVAFARPAPDFLRITHEAAQERVGLSHTPASNLAEPILVSYQKANYWYFREIGDRNMINTDTGTIETYLPLSNLPDADPAFESTQNTEIVPETVPYLSQLNGPWGGLTNWCFAYSTSMLLAWWGASSTHDANADGHIDFNDMAYDVARYALNQNPPPNEGSYPGLCKYAVDQMTANGDVNIDIRTMWHGSMKSMTESQCGSTSPGDWTDWKTDIYNGVPVAAAVDTPYGLHMVVVMGYDDTDSYVAINDPSGALVDFPVYDNLALSYSVFDAANLEPAGQWIHQGFPDKDSIGDWGPHFHHRLGFIMVPGDNTFASPVVTLTPPPSSMRDGDVIGLTATLKVASESAGYVGMHIRVGGGSIYGSSSSDFSSQQYDLAANPVSSMGPVIEFERYSASRDVTYTAVVQIVAQSVGTMQISYRGWVTDLEDKVHCNYNPSYVNPWQVRLHTVTVDDDRGPAISMPRVESRITRDPNGVADDRYNGANFLLYPTYTYSTTVSNSGMSISESLSPAECLPSQSVTVQGAVTYGSGSPAQHCDVGISIPQTGASWMTTTDGTGHYSCQIVSPSLIGSYSVDVWATDGLLYASNSRPLVVTSSGGWSTFSVVRGTTCRDVQAVTPYDPIGETSYFRTNDVQVNAWIHLLSVTSPLTVRFNFYAPSGSLYGYSQDVPVVPYWDWYKCWAGWYIAGNAMSDLEGAWTVQILVNEGGGFRVAATAHFTIGYEATGWTMARDVQQTDPYEPIGVTNVFLNTDEKAWAWMRLDRVTQSLQVQWRWHQPGGAQYTYSDYTTLDPGMGNYYPWYKLWCYMNIGGTEVQSKLGQWRVDACIMDSFGTWDVVYSQYFSIVDNTPPGVPGTPDDHGDFSTTGTVTWTWSPAVEDDMVSLYNIQIGTYPDGNDVLDGFTEVCSRELSGLTDGLVYYARVRAENRAGQWGDWSASSDGIRVDTQAPQTTAYVYFDGGMLNGYVRGTIYVALSPSDIVSGTSATYYSIDYSAWQDYAGTIVLTEDGNHIVRFFSEDFAGNSEQIKEEYARIDWGAPSCNLMIDFGAYYAFSRSVTLTLDANDAVSGLWRLSVSDGGSTWSDWQDYSPTVTYELSAWDGLHTVYVRVSDFAGNEVVASSSITLVTPDQYEFDDTYLEAKPITPGIVQFHNIDDYGFDDDWVVFTLSETCDVRFYLSGGSGNQIMRLYDSVKVPVTPNWTGLEIVEAFSVAPGDYYLMVDGNGYVIPEYALLLTVDSVFSPLFEIEVSTSKSLYAIGEPVQISISVTNIGTGAGTLTFTSGLVSYFEVQDWFGWTCYDSRIGGISPPMTVEITLLPGQKYYANHTWDQFGNNELLVPRPAEYAVVGVLPADEGSLFGSTSIIMAPDDLTFPIVLNAGWNMLSVPILNYTLNASGLGLAQGDEIAEWDSSTQAYTSVYVVGISPPSFDFAIEPGRSYFVYSVAGESIVLRGCSPAALPSCSLSLSVPAGGGWACVGVNTEGECTASELASMISGANPWMVCRWNSTRSCYESYVVGLPLNNFTIAPGDGVWIWVDGPCTLTFTP